VLGRRVHDVCGMWGTWKVCVLSFACVLTIRNDEKMVGPHLVFIPESRGLITLAV
jgi:hypothetical protein